MRDMIPTEVVLAEWVAPAARKRRTWAWDLGIGGVHPMSVRCLIQI